MPLVIDVVNVRACSIHHFRSYGFWAPAIQDYTRENIQERMRTPPMPSCSAWWIRISIASG